MTLNLLWRSAERALVIADTAESRRVDMRFPISSFGEYAAASEDHSQESAMKLVQIGSHGVAAASGDGRAARAMMDELEHLPTGALVGGVAAALLAAAERTEAEGIPTRGVHWSCAEWREGELATFAWRRAGGVRPETREGLVLISGSLTDDLADGFRYVAHAVCSAFADARARGAVLPATGELSVLVAVVQGVLGAEGLLAQRGIGGAVVGAVVGPTGVAWVPDTIYQVVGPDYLKALPPEGHEATIDLRLSASGVVAMSVRDGCLFLRSTLTDQAKVLVPGRVQQKADAWRATWEPRVREPAFWKHATAAATINPVQRSISVALGDFTRPNTLLELSLAPETGELAVAFGQRYRAGIEAIAAPSHPWRVIVDAAPPFDLDPQEHCMKGHSE